MRITILGGGFCGTALALRLARHPQNAAITRIDLVEPAATLGPGVAYATTEPAHLLNVRRGDLGLDADDPQGFARYLAAAHRHVAGDFVPRALYGRYLAAEVAAVLARSPWRERFRHWRTAATDAVPAPGGGATIALADGQTLAADRVALCLGNTSARLPPVTGLAELAPPRAVLRPWQWEGLAALPAAGPVLVLGTGLTMVDTALALFGRGFAGRVVTVSRRGLSPLGHLPTAPPRPPPQVAPGTEDASWPRLVHAMRRAGEAARAGVGGWQAAVDSLRPVTPQLWGSLGPAQRASFLRHARPYWDCHRHRVAPEVAAQLASWRASGQLVVRAGRVLAVAPTAAGIVATVQARGHRSPESLAATCVVNCTGTDVDWRTTRVPLLVALRGRGLLRPDLLGLGAEAAADGALYDAQGTASPWLYALGAALSGRDFEAVAVPELRQHARTTADAWLGAGPLGVTSASLPGRKERRENSPA